MLNPEKSHGAKLAVQPAEKYWCELGTEEEDQVHAAQNERLLQHTRPVKVAQEATKSSTAVCDPSVLRAATPYVQHAGDEDLNKKECDNERLGEAQGCSFEPIATQQRPADFEDN